MIDMTHLDLDPNHVWICDDGKSFEFHTQDGTVVVHTDQNLRSMYHDDLWRLYDRYIATL